MKTTKRDDIYRGKAVARGTIHVHQCPCCAEYFRCNGKVCETWPEKVCAGPHEE